MDDIVFAKRPHRGWTAVDCYNGIHVVPVEDSIEHFASGCPCGPQEQLIQEGPNASRGDVWMHVHSSLDGRERYEPAAGRVEPDTVTEEEPHG